MNRKSVIILMIIFTLTAIFPVGGILTAGAQTSPTLQNTGVLNAVVSVKVLNVREGPGTTYKLVCQLKQGDVVKVFGKMGDWYAVYHTKTGCVGASASKYLKIAGGKVPNTIKYPTKTPGKYVPKKTPQTSTPQKPKIPQSTSKPPVANTPSTGNVNTTADDKQLLDLVNKARADNGAKPLAFDAELMKCAIAKAKDMVAKNYFDHQSPTYGSPFDMMRTFGISFKTAGENIAGNPTVADAFDKWMHSEGHKKNILNPSFNYVGFGIVDSPTYGKVLVQQFIGR